MKMTVELAKAMGFKQGISYNKKYYYEHPVGICFPKEILLKYSVKYIVDELLKEKKKNSEHDIISSIHDILRIR